jgi:hypothetical protein
VSALTLCPCRKGESILWAENGHLEQRVLYLGHLTFTGPAPETESAPTPLGWFTLLAEAGSVEAAMETFRERVKARKGWFATFESVSSVWVGDITEVKQLPSEGA